MLLKWAVGIAPNYSDICFVLNEWQLRKSLPKNTFDIIDIIRSHPNICRQLVITTFQIRSKSTTSINIHLESMNLWVIFKWVSLIKLTMKSVHVYESAPLPLSSQVKDSLELSLLPLLRACRIEPSLTFCRLGSIIKHVLNVHRKKNSYFKKLQHCWFWCK